MERTSRSADELPAELGRPVETAFDWSLMDVAFVDEFDEQEGRCRVKYDSIQMTPSLAVIVVVSNITGRDPLELDPLYDSIDSDALDALFTADMSSVSQVTFQYSGCEITVGSDDVVGVTG